jgi:DNA polymerase III subunit delta
MFLLIGKAREEIRRALGELLRDNEAPISSFYSENFSVDHFFQEVETLPFLSQKKVVIIHELDQISEVGVEAIRHYLEKPSPWISLYLIAHELDRQNKLVTLVEKKGKVLRFKEEKPWEKEKRLAEWLMAEAKRENLRLSLQAATALVQGVDHQMLKSELDKLICLAHTRGEITLEDISLLSTPVHHETLWHLGDALFTKATSKALEIGRILLEEGMTIFPLLASLRTQFITGIEILTSPAEAAKKFPYLKGGLLDKKLQMFKKYGKAQLNQGALLIFETEVKAKNSSADPLLLLELLIVKLTHDTLSSPQLALAT